MSEVDRPIKPDQKYLEEYLQRINRVQTKPFLKKKNNPSLPCNAYRDIQQHHNNQEQHYQKTKKTKAEIYEQIKQKNLQKFGQRKPKTVIVQQTKKRIDPKKMTINYKAKPVIDTTEYKKQGFIPHPKASQLIPQNKQKIEYQKLIDYFNKELKSLQQEKEQFSKVAQKLKFKESIKHQEGLFYSRVKSEVQKQLIRTQSQAMKAEETINQKRTNHHSREAINKRVISQQKEHISKTYSAGQIRSKLQKTCSQLQLLKSQMMHQTLEIQQHRYEIFQVHLLPSFTPQALYDFLDISSLKYNGNSLYKAAMKAFNSKFQKQNKAGNAEEVAECMSSGIKQKFVGQKRISKYGDWTEVWTPGKQRLMTNKDSYRVVWLSNGDVIQSFSNQIKASYSKSKQIIKIQFKSFPTIYYHEQLQQIWRYLSDGSREIVFSNGRLDIIKQHH